MESLTADLIGYLAEFLTTHHQQILWIIIPTHWNLLQRISRSLVVRGGQDESKRRLLQAYPENIRHLTCKHSWIGVSQSIVPIVNNLQSLRLHRLNGFSSALSFPKLTELDLDDCKVSKSLSFVCPALTKLTYTDFHPWISPEAAETVGQTVEIIGRLTQLCELKIITQYSVPAMLDLTGNSNLTKLTYYPENNDAALLLNENVQFLGTSVNVDVGHLTKLIDLTISFSRLSGNLPDTSTLKRLHINRKSYDEDRDIGLGKLNLQSYRDPAYDLGVYHESWKEIQQMQVKTLTVSYTSLTDLLVRRHTSVILGLVNLTKLAVLHEAGADLSGLTNLHTLTINGAQRYPTSLKKLDLKSSWLNPADLIGIKLEELTAKVHVTDDLTHLQSLTKLNLTAMTVGSDRDLRALTNLQYLEDRVGINAPILPIQSRELKVVCNNSGYFDDLDKFTGLTGLKVSVAGISTKEVDQLRDKLNKLGNLQTLIISE